MSSGVRDSTGILYMLLMDSVSRQHHWLPGVARMADVGNRINEGNHDNADAISSHSRHMHVCATEHGRSELDYCCAICRSAHSANCTARLWVKCGIA